MKKNAYVIKNPVNIRATPVNFDHLDPKPQMHKTKDGREIKLGR